MFLFILMNNDSVFCARKMSQWLYLAMVLMLPSIYLGDIGEWYHTLCDHVPVNRSEN